MEMRRKVIKYGLLWLLPLLFISCGEQPFYDSAHSFEDKIWQESDTALFEVDVTDTLQEYDFILTFRNTTDYKYSNIWVNIATTAPDESTSVIAQRIKLAAGDGSWLGRTSGTVVENRLHYKTNNFPIKGKYLFKISQAVQQEVIDEVLDISLRIVPKK